MIFYEAIELSIFFSRTFTFQIIRWRNTYIYPKQFKPALLTHHPFARSPAPAGVALKYLGGAVA